MKKFLMLAICFSLFLLLGIPRAYAADILVTVDDKPVRFLSNSPYIDDNGRTMIPLRAVADALGCETIWDSNRQSATVQKTLIIDNQLATLSQTFYPCDIDFCFQWTASAVAGGTYYDLGINAMNTRSLVKNGSTYLPIRYVAEFFGYTVQWDNVSQTVKISSGGKPGNGISDFTLKNPTSGDLTLQELCSSAWVSNGYRNSDTNIYLFTPDGTLSVEWANNASPLSGTYLLQGNTVVASTFNGNRIEYYDYDPEKNILVSRNGRKIVEQEINDSYGNHFEGKTTVEILEPYRENPYASSKSANSLRKSVAPAQFSESNIKQTVRPYLQALSFLEQNNPVPFLKLDYTSSWYDNNDWQYILVKNFTSVNQIKANMSSFFTEEYLQANFPDDAFQVIDGNLYYISGAKGSGLWDANSVTYIGLIGKGEIAVEVDSYGSGENYCGTYTIYFREIENHYFLSGTSWEHRNKNIPSHDYTPIDWDPV